MSGEVRNEFWAACERGKRGVLILEDANDNNRDLVSKVLLSKYPDNMINALLE